MRITYSLSVKDMRQAQLIADLACRSELKRPVGLKLVMVIVVASLVLFGAASLGMYQKYPAPVTNDLSWVVVPAVTAIGGIFLLVMGSKRNFENTRFKTMGPFPIEQTLSVEAGGVHIEGEKGSCFLPWRALRTVEEFPEHLAITTSQWLVFVIPNEAIGGHNQRGAFVNELRKKLSP